MKVQLAITIREWVGVVWNKLKESLFIDAIQALFLFGAKKVLIIWILVANEFALYIDQFPSLIG